MRMGLEGSKLKHTAGGIGIILSVFQNDSFSQYDLLKAMEEIKSV